MPFKTSLILVLIMLFTNAAKASDDYVFIFGYGSLMLTPARTATSPDPEGAVYIPVKIRGIERLWNLWSEYGQQRTLGVEQNKAPDAFVSGLIFAAKKDQLAAFDEREGPAYQRVQIPIENVTFYLDNHQEIVAQSKRVTDIYVYSPRKESSFYFDKSHDQKKIAMSYLNVVRAGCVEIDKTHQLNGLFVNDCVQTMGLEGYLVDDDRRAPRYPRYPATLLKKAIESGNTEKTEELQRFIQVEWKNYLNTISEKWEEK